MTVLVIELLEVIDIQHDQSHTLGGVAQRLLQQASEGVSIEHLSQAVQRRGQLDALKLVSQAFNLILSSVQLGEETLLLVLHELGALLQFAEYGGQPVNDRL